MGKIIKVKPAPADVRPDAVVDEERVDQPLADTVVQQDGQMDAAPEGACGETSPIDRFLPPSKTSGKRKYRFLASRPTDLQFFVQGTHDFGRVIGGVPKQAYINEFADNGDGTYTMGVGGFTTGVAQKPVFSGGLSFQDWKRINDADKPGQVIYAKNGPRLTLDGTVFKYDTYDHSQYVTLSTQQAEEFFGGAIDEVADGMADVAQGDFSSVVTLPEVLKAMAAGYDISQDATTTTLERSGEAVYWDVGLMIWGDVERDFNASRPVSLINSFSIGSGARYANFGGNEFMQVPLELETSLVRVKYGPVRVDGLITAGAAFYAGIDSGAIFNGDYFWESDRLMGSAHAGITVRVTTNLIESDRIPPAVARAAVATAEVTADGARAVGKAADHVMTEYAETALNIDIPPGSF